MRKIKIFYTIKIGTVLTLVLMVIARSSKKHWLNQKYWSDFVP